MRIISGLTALLTVSALSAAQAQTTTDTSMYPAAEAGQVQHIITLPTFENEGNYLLEIVGAQKLMGDCNRIMIGADLSDDDVKGWGYTYYTIDDVSQPMTTMMACPTTPKSEQLVTFNLGSDALVRYNSKLPLVVYAPEGVSVGYRLWQTDGTLHGITTP